MTTPEHSEELVQEARRLLRSTTPLMSSSAWLAILGLGPTAGQARRFHLLRRARGALPSARAMRVAPPPPSREGERLPGIPRRRASCPAPSALGRADRGDGASQDASDAATTTGADPLWTPPRERRHYAVASLAGTYERQVEALLELAVRCRLQTATAETARLGGSRRPSAYAATSRGAAPIVAAKAHSAAQLEDLRKETGYVLAELRVTTCRMVQHLRHAQQQHEARRQLRREAYEQPG